MKLQWSNFLLALVLTCGSSSSSRQTTAFAGVSSSPPSSSSASSASVAAASAAGQYLSNIPVGAPDAILGIAEAFKRCDDPDKVNVCVGACE